MELSPLIYLPRLRRFGIELLFTVVLRPSQLWLSMDRFAFYIDLFLAIKSFLNVCEDTVARSQGGATGRNSVNPDETLNAPHVFGAH
jgi:hypothetical protein